MEVSNGGIPSFEKPKYETEGVKGKTRNEGKEADFGQQFPQENDEEKVLKGPQEIEGQGNFEKPNVHRISPAPYGLMSPSMLPCFGQNFD